MMKKKTVAAWTLAAIMATTGAATLSAKNGKGEAKAEAKWKERSSIQVAQKSTDEAALQKLAKMTLEQAIQIAQGAVPGAAIEAKLEDEDQNLVYTVEVSNAGSTSEVIIDAGNGKVLAVQADGADEGRDGGEDDDKDGDSD